MELMACPECLANIGKIDPNCSLCRGTGEVIAPMFDDDYDDDSYTQGYELREDFQLFVRYVNHIVEPFLATFEYKRYPNNIANRVDPIFAKSWHDPRYPQYEWNLEVIYEYRESTEILDYRSFSIQVGRSVVNQPRSSLPKTVRTKNLTVGYRQLLWIPEYLNDIVFPYIPIGADVEHFQEYPHPQRDWYYRDIEELQKILTVSLEILPPYLELIEEFDT